MHWKMDIWDYLLFIIEFLRQYYFWAIEFYIKTIQIIDNLRFAVFLLCSNLFREEFNKLFVTYSEKS